MLKQLRLLSMIQATEVNFQCIAKGFIPVTFPRQIVVKPRETEKSPVCLPVPKTGVSVS